MECGPLRRKGRGGVLGAGKGKKKVKDEAQILEQITSSKQQEQEQRELDKQSPAQVAFETFCSSSLSFLSQNWTHQPRCASLWPSRGAGSLPALLGMLVLMSDQRSIYSHLQISLD